MPAQVLVSRVRVSRIAGQIHDQLREIGQPNQFERLLANPDLMKNLPVTLPFGPNLDVDNEFWKKNVERKLTEEPVDARELRRAAVPLRYHGKLDTAADTPRLEAHLHPFGVVVNTTVDLVWSNPVDLQQVQARVRTLEAQSATVAVGNGKHTTTFREASTVATGALINRLAAVGGRSWDTTPHRLITVISGNFNPSPISMPAVKDPLRLALHDLSNGQPNLLPQRDNAFVSQWTGGDYGWPPVSLVYMLDGGTAALSTEAEEDPPDEAELYGESTSDQHRRLLLTLAYVTALASLVQGTAKGTTNSQLFGQWANRAAERFGRLYGPDSVYKKWGLMPRALLLRNGLTDEIDKLRVAMQLDPLKPGKFSESTFPP